MAREFFDERSIEAQKKLKDKFPWSNPFYLVDPTYQRSPDILGEFQHIPLWNGDRWLESWAHRRFTQFRERSLRWVDDIYGYIVINSGLDQSLSLQEIVLERAFFEYGREHRRSTGFAFVTSPFSAADNEHRIDLIIDQGAWSVHEGHLKRLGIPVDEQVSLLARPTIYPVWRADFSLYPPQTLVTLQNPLHIYDRKTHFPRALW